MKINDITGHVVDASITVHSVLGPGLLESAYKACLVHELRKRGLTVLTEIPVPIVYDGVVVDVGYRMDLLVEDTVIVEVKAVRQLAPVHDAQLLSHLVLSGHKVGLLVNFHVRFLKHGIRRLVNNL